MKYWHKRLERRAFYELTESQKVSAVYELEDAAEDETYFVNTKAGANEMDGFYYLSEFTSTQDDSRYDGIASLCNTAAIGIILADDCEQAIVQCFG